MKLGYDNLEDAKTKLNGTFCLYKGKSIVIKTVDDPVGNNKFIAFGSSLFSGRGIQFEIDDPEFNCSNYNIGYINQNQVTAWMYRMPLKQWRQGLRYDQVKFKASQRGFYEGISARASKNLAQMLENIYPSFEVAAEQLKSEAVFGVAFHKNFAMTLDKIHKDFILEYKGTNIGFTHNLKDMSLLDEYKHLEESLKEATGG